MTRKAAGMIKYFVPIAVVCSMLASCMQDAVKPVIVQQLCPDYNPVFIEHHGNDSAMYWIPNCFAPGDSSSPNDSLVEFERNMAQVVITITDSANNIVMVYDNKTFQNPGFAGHTVWYGNYYGQAAAEKRYSLKVTGTTLFGTAFSMNGSVSLLRYFFGKDSTSKAKVLVNCDTCTFNSQWNGSNVNLQLPTNEHFVTDAYHQCN